MSIPNFLVSICKMCVLVKDFSNASYALDVQFRDGQEAFLINSVHPESFFFPCNEFQDTHSLVISCKSLISQGLKISEMLLIGLFDRLPPGSSRES